jgi:large subunit ribosomal protein L2
MPIKVYNPITPARRKTSALINRDLDKVKPLKSLMLSDKRRAGRNNTGKITVRHQGGGSRKLIRVVDFIQSRYDIPAKVAAIEYDPNRSTNIARLVYADGVKSYIIAPESLRNGDSVLSSQKSIAIKIANRLPLKHIPTGTIIYNVELVPGKGGRLARSAGSSLTLMSLSDGKAQLKMPSGEIRLVSEDCSASIGVPSNIDWRNVRWGKAGRMRHRGIRPTVRGKVMNPVDHPHGGGEGHNPIGLKHPKTYTGKPALGVKTRKGNKYSNKFIVQRRKKK